MRLVKKYFPNITATQIEQFTKLTDLYAFWNKKINVISRKDIEALELHHVLHSLSIARIIQFKPGTKIMDVGTGGGFPGIPLAILFPESEFYLIDSIGKKIKVVNAIKTALSLNNVKTEKIRVQQVKKQFDFVISRAVTSFPKFVNMVRTNIHHEGRNALPNGILYLKGGDFQKEISKYLAQMTLLNCNDFFEEEFFKTKKIIHLTL